MTFRKPKSPRARRMTLGLAALATILVIVVVVVASASSSSSSSSTHATTSSPAAASASASTPANRTAFAQCLKEHGVTIAPHAQGNGTAAHSGLPPAGSAGAGSGNSAHQAAFQACGATGQHTPGSHP